ncbi:MAG: hypothetical protein NC299_06195 [Lachnospiraceae bacterium]|nr:hypothetical protein [Ruminococcus sp.]MCM1274944.1 hypothetical protein [Lachnospiraceae bacterium]
MAQKTSAKPRRGIKEFFRKIIVSLKRSPQNIAMLVLAAAFIVYSLNLTSIANTTAKVNLANMGQCEFAAMLFSILAFVCFLRAFPKRQKPSYVMIALVFVMMALLVFVDIVYYTRIIEAVTRTDPQPIAITADTAYIAIAQNVVVVHIILIAAAAVLLAALPVYSKMIRKINTSIDVEDNGELEVIDISGED